MSPNHPDAPRQIDIPIDILCTIFELLGGTDRLHLGLSKFESFLHWIPEATHVCRYWRDAALSARYLWTNINVAASITWALEFARRSGNAPICILVQPSPYPHSKVYECTKTLFHENMQRIRSISFHGVANCDETLIMSTLSDDTHSRTGVGPAFYPIIQDLNISFYSSSRFLLTNDTIRAPELQRLSLTYCSFGVEFGSLRNLSHLSISESASISPRCLHRVLSQTPNLETLVLESNFESITVDSNSIQPVTLPKLLQIEILAQDTEWPSAILQLISYGPQRNLVVPSHQVGYHSERILSLFTSIMSHARESSSIDWLGLSILPSRLALRASRGSSQPNIDFYIFFPTQLPMPYPHGSGPNLLDGLLRRINCQDLCILHLESAENLSARLWVEFFGSLPSLAAVSISGGERELFGALIIETGNIPVLTNTGMLSAGGDRAAFPFQTLSVISVSKRKETYVEEDIEFMLNCLRKRLDLGLGITSLSFFQCEARLKSQVAAFNSVVGLKWISRPDGEV